MRSGISYILYKILPVVVFTLPYMALSQCDLSVQVEIEDFTTTSIPIYVENALNNDLSDPDQGVCGIFIEFEHTHVGDLLMELVSPSGQTIAFVGTVVNSGNTSATNWNVFFTQCGSPSSPDSGFDPVWSNNQSWGILASYTGSYYPNAGCLEDFNNGSVNGTWTLNIIDANLFDSGELHSFSILFCDPSGLDCIDCFEIQNESMITGGVLDCNNPTVNLTLDSPFEFDSLKWTGPDGFASNQMQVEVNQAGIYYLTAFFNGLCTGSFEYELKEDFYAPEISVSDGYIDCFSPEISLNLTVIMEEEVESYAWVGPGGFMGEQMNPTVNNGGDYFVTVTNNNGCTAVELINVESNFQEPKITVQNIILDCVPDSVQIDLSVDIPVISHSWNGPNGFNSDLPDPKVIDTGVYYIIVQAFNGCLSTDSIHVLQSSESPSFAFEQIGAINCISDSVILLVKEYEPGALFEWSDLNGVISMSDSLMVSDTGSIKVVITGQSGCKDSISIEVILDTIPPMIGIGEEGYLKCTNLSMQLNTNGSSAGDSISYLWNTPDGMILSDSTLANIEITKEGTYFLQVENSENGCISMDSIEILELENDLHDLTAELLGPSCPEAGNGVIVLSEILGGKPPYLYAVDEGMFVSEQVFTGLGEGEHIIAVKDQDGCMLESTVFLEAEELFQVDLGPDIQVYPGEIVLLELYSSLSDAAIDSILWSPDDLTSCFDCAELEFTANTSETISVTVIDTNHCINTSTVNIELLISEDYYIPNIFSPNGDGVNDYFQVYDNGAIRQIRQMIIFDKRGIPYFHKEKFKSNVEADGWDGRWEGRKASLGVYIYYVEIELVSGETIWVSGDISLIR